VRRRMGEGDAQRCRIDDPDTAGDLRSALDDSAMLLDQSQVKRGSS